MPRRKALTPPLRLPPPFRPPPFRPPVLGFLLKASRSSLTYCPACLIIFTTSFADSGASPREDGSKKE